MERLEMPLGRHTLSIETGKMAKQADGAVVVRLGDTVVLATACGQREPRPGFDFLPLTVDYREANYAAGKIPGGFFKREGRPNEKEVLTSRMIDRPLRPLFPKGYACETQVIGLLLSADLENDSDTLSIIGASTALLISDIPFEHAVAAVRVGYWDGACVINPSSAELKAKSQLNLLVAGTEEAIVMVEAGASEVPEEVMVQALSQGHDVIKQITAIQKELRSRVGKPKRPFAKKEIDPVVEEILLSLGADLSGSTVGAVYGDRMLIGAALDEAFAYDGPSVVEVRIDEQHGKGQGLPRIRTDPLEYGLVDEGRPTLERDEQRTHLVGEVAHADTQLGVVAEPGGVDAHGAGGLAVAVIGEALQAADLLEAAVALDLEVVAVAEDVAHLHRLALVVPVQPAQR